MRLLPCTTRFSRPLLAALFALGTAACSGDDEADSSTPPNTKAHNVDDGPLYLVATAFFTSDQVETYLTTTDSFDKKTKVDVTSGTKLLGEIVPVVSEGKVYVTDEADPASIKRFEVGADNHLKQTGEISF